MFFVISKILAFIITPLVWIVGLFLAGLLVKRQPLKKRLLITSFVMLWFFSNDFILDEFMRAWEVPAIDNSAINGQYDVGIVLGGMIDYDQSFKRVDFKDGADRLFQAVELYKEGKIKRILLDGGSGSLLKEWKEAPVLHNYLVKIGLPDSVLVVEPNSRNTRENAVFAKHLLDSVAPHGRYLLITSASHMRRATKCFTKAGIATLAYSTDRHSGPRKFIFDHVFIPDISALQGWDELLHEWMGYITYKISGYI